MKKILTILLLSVFLLSCEKKSEEKIINKTASSNDKYYSKVNGKSGEELKKTLNKIITENHQKLTYKKAYDALEFTDEDPNNSENIILFYTGRSQPKKLRSQFDY